MQQSYQDQRHLTLKISSFFQGRLPVHIKRKKKGLREGEGEERERRGRVLDAEHDLFLG